MSEDAGAVLARVESNIEHLYRALGARETRCKACEERIWFVRMPSGKLAPYTRHALNHFANCAAAGRFRPPSSSPPTGAP